MKKKIMIIISIVLIITAVLVTMIFVMFNKQKSELKNTENFSQNIHNPDRIVYKNQDKYYEIKSDNELYYNIINEMAKNIDTSKKETVITQEEVDNIHNLNSFIEFDYNTISKNCILTIENNSKFIKLLDSGADLIHSNVPNTKSIQNLIEKKIDKNNYYTMLNNKEYISKNILSGMQYKYLQQFKSVENGSIYQKVIEDYNTLELYTAMCNLSFDTEIASSIFDKNVVVLTLSTPKNIQVKINIGNIKYYYDNITNYGDYTAHLLVVSKIVNSSCIYNINNASIKTKAEIAESNNKFNEEVSNIDENIFVKDFETYLNSNYENQSITQNQADEIADKGFKQATSIVGEYSKDTQTVETQEVFANNFFTRKSYEGDTVYNLKGKVKCYIYTREDSMRNGVSIYIDIRTGKIIGGYAFGD